MCQNYDILNYCWVHKKNYDIISHKGVLVLRKSHRSWEAKITFINLRIFEFSFKLCGTGKVATTPALKKSVRKTSLWPPNKACFDPSQMIVFWPALIIHHTCQMDLHQASSLVPDKTLWSQKILKIFRFWSLL